MNQSDIFRYAVAGVIALTALVALVGVVAAWWREK